MDRVPDPAGPGCERFPRRRGDGPLRLLCTKILQPFPPQARGWTRQAEGDRKRPAVSPAGAGMDPSVPRRRARSGGFPRRRGDGPVMRDALLRRGEFPPQARGWTPLPPSSTATTSVSPAGAGMDPRTAPSRPASTRFPRRRGDGPLNCSLDSCLVLFPPQARGWTLHS